MRNDQALHHRHRDSLLSTLSALLFQLKVPIERAESIGKAGVVFDAAHITWRSVRSILDAPSNESQADLIQKLTRILTGPDDAFTPHVIDPVYSLSIWKAEVRNDDTRLGYWEWVSHKHESEDEDDDPDEEEDSSDEDDDFDDWDDDDDIDDVDNDAEDAEAEAG
jgi:hypothetical protein